MAYGYPQYYPQIPYYNAQQTAMPDQLAQLRAAQQPMMQQLRRLQMQRKLQKMRHR